LDVPRLQPIFRRRPFENRSRDGAARGTAESKDRIGLDPDARRYP
jgi:hypothetical protein